MTQQLWNIVSYAFFSFATLFSCFQPRPELTQSLSSSHSTFFRGYGSSNLTPLSAEPCTMTTDPLRGGEATTQSHPLQTSLHFPTQQAPLPNALPFSWTDTAQIALGSCMPCLRLVSSSDSSHINRRPN